MPELPEVETIRRGLGDFILNKKIKRVKVDFPKAFIGKVEEVEGAKVVGLRRRGKALLIDLDNGETVLIHLRMTGQLIYRDSLLGRAASLNPASATQQVATIRSSPHQRKPVFSELGSYGWQSQGDKPSSFRCSDFPRISSQLTSSQDDTSSGLTSSQDGANPEMVASLEGSSGVGSRLSGVQYDDFMKHQFAAGHPSKNFTAELPNAQTRVTFEFADGKLFFNDQRKFGFMKVLDTEAVEQEKFIAELGKEPWEMTAEELFEKCQRHKSALIKAVLLDQKVMAGLGNIYADESLFYASVHPMRRAGSLSQDEVAMILEGACKVMTASIDSGGSTMATYVRPDGTTGDYLEKFAQVFRKEGTPCPRCKATIIKIRVAGRGTHICPSCQQLEGSGVKKAEKVVSGESKKEAKLRVRRGENA